MIQNGDQAPIAVSYQELEATLGPRQPGFGEVPLANLVGMFAVGLGGGSSAEFTYFNDLFKVVAAAVGVAVLVAVLALGFGSVARSRRRAPDQSEERLFN